MVKKVGGAAGLRIVLSQIICLSHVQVRFVILSHTFDVL